jgi:hypothetical protein
MDAISQKAWLSALCNVISLATTAMFLSAPLMSARCWLLTASQMSLMSYQQFKKSNARRRNVRRNKTANERKGGIVRTLGLMGLW